MSDPDDEQPPTERIPEALIEQLNALGPPGLRTVHEYVERLLESTQPPIEAQIREEATGEILDIEDWGIYTLVRKRPLGGGESSEDTPPVSLYHVTRERHLDGEEALHWAFLGDVHERGQ
ncbi:hypothetical protein [Natronorubrum halophilum]|uniref:hypothetical protein n=1 Tax=Natronorubrum halophilum TaxID=1702106 RepID=UPI000EF73F29|nr:hypothetical protein [Natronorubrum halophilum]